MNASTTELVVENTRPAHNTQYLAAFSASMGAMAVGAAIGYSSPASAAFRYHNSTENDTSGDFCLTEDERGWFAGTLSIGALLGCMLAGLSINNIGRRGTMLVSVLPLMVGWLLIGLAENLAMLICGRLLCGLCTGISSLVVPTYTTEYASKDIRGALGSGFQLFVTVGILYAYVLGTMVEWRLLAAICAALGLIFLPLAALLKESPNYLLAKGKEKEARQSMQYFRGQTYNIDKEMAELKLSLEESCKAKVSLWDLTTPYILKPLMITLALMIFQQLAGVNAVIYNIVIIFKDSGSSMSEDVSTIIVGIVQVLATATSVFLIDRIGRKFLLSLSSGVMSVSISELFYPNVKEAAGSLATTINWTCVFIITFTFEPLQDALNDYGVYWLFGSFCAINFVFCVMLVPETKGRTLQETTAYFGGPGPN